MKIELKNVLNIFDQDHINEYSSEIEIAYKELLSKTGKGNDFLGWIDLPDQISTELIEDIQLIAKKINLNSEIFVVIGIGGSYLGARAIIDALSHHFVQLQDEKKSPLILYAGQNISEDYLCDLIEILNKKDYSLAVISKSGTTTEPAIAFRLLKEHLEKKYGREEAVKRIFAITDSNRGALKELANIEGYKTYDIPDDVGGRYSVLTPVGLLPIAVAGYDIRAFINGAKSMKKELLTKSTSFDSNPATQYAIIRNLLYQNGFTNEIMVNYEPRLFYFTEWWKQLYGESEGKENKGIFPAGVGFTTDLHSMGQYIQEGIRNLFETVISIENSNKELKIPKNDEDLDKLNYISGKRISSVNHMAEIGTTLAHVDGGVPNIQIRVPEISEFVLGQLVFFFEFACALSGYLLKVNPFDQPGVEAYKSNMFALLGKKGFEKETETIRKRI
ncbi:MAG: glucose-6-phosphate isomerase [Bacteroidetes bacterium]|nr:glucose-6-phosphate isomerase [Bacteroidota bacterium]